MPGWMKHMLESRLMEEISTTSDNLIYHSNGTLIPLHCANEGPYGQSCGFHSSHVWMWELDHKEDWVPKNWSFWTVVLKKTLNSTVDCKKIKPVNPKGNQSWIFIGRTDAEAEAPILWPPDVKNKLIGKDPDAGKDWRQKENRMAEDEMVR